MNYMDQYRKLQQFTSVKEFDKHRSGVFYRIKDKLSKGALAVWNVLSQHSLEVPGVCWIQINNIAKVSGVSRSTVERSLRLFKKLGVLKVIETFRPVKGGDGANVYVFQKLGEGAQMTGRENGETPCETKDEPAKSERVTKTSLSNKNNISHLNNNRRPYLKYVPKSLQHFQALFGQMTKTIYGRVWFAVKKLEIIVDHSDVQHVALIVFEQLKTYIKSNKHLSKDQICKLAFVIAYNQLSQRIERGDIYDLSDIYQVIYQAKQRKSLDSSGNASSEDKDLLGIY